MGGWGYSGSMWPSGLPAISMCGCGGHLNGPGPSQATSEIAPAPPPKTDLPRSPHDHLLLVLNVIFAVVAVISQVGENVTLPLWTGATSALGNENCTRTSSEAIISLEDVITSSSNSSGNQAMMDPFFVLSFASLSFVVIFGIATAVLGIAQLLVNGFAGRKVLSFITVEDDLKFPQWQLILIGILDALNGIFVVFASLPSRTAPFLQVFLGNFILPLTILLRFALLHKRPTILKLVSAIAVLLGLVFSLVPVFTGMDNDSKEGNKEYLSQTRLRQILWPLCFIFGFIPAAVMNVIGEMSLKSTRKVNLFFLLFWTSLYQMLTVWALFWVNIIPEFGFVDSFKHFGENYKFALQCFFGGVDCGYQPGLTGTIFIVMYVANYVGGGLLLRYSEGAAYLAVVQSLVTPLGALFWSIFTRDECAHFLLHPHAGSLTYFSIGGMVIMVPAIFLYNIGTLEELKRILHIKKHCQYQSTVRPHPL